MRLILVPLAAAGFAFAVVTGATQLIKPATPTPQAASSLIWADRVFVSAHDMERWLRARGATYEEWRRRHPAASTTFETHADATSSSQRTLEATGAAPSDSNVDRTLGIVLLVIAPVGLLLLLGAATRMRRPTLRAHLAGDALASARVFVGRARPHPHAAGGQRVRLPALSAHSAGDALASARMFVARARPHLPARVPNDPAGSPHAFAATVRAHGSEIAWYMIAILLALAIGTSIAVYLT